MARQQIGIYGGTFNTFHAGHRKVAELALSYSAPSLDLLVVAPARNPYFRAAETLRPYAERHAAAANGTRDLERVRVLDLDDVNAPSYTLNLIAAVKTWHGAAAEITLVIGSDILSQLHRWHRVAEVAKAANFWVAGRAAPDAKSADGSSSAPPRINAPADGANAARGNLSELLDASIRGQVRLTHIGDTNIALSATELAGGA